MTQRADRKPDESRLLTDEEMQSTFQDNISVRGGGFWRPEEIAKLQDAKTASVLEAECQQRVERIMAELEEHYQTFDKSGDPIVNIDYRGANGSRKEIRWWLGLKKHEGVK